MAVAMSPEEELRSIVFDQYADAGKYLSMGSDDFDRIIDIYTENPEFLLLTDDNPARDVLEWLLDQEEGQANDWHFFDGQLNDGEYTRIEEIISALQEYKENHLYLLEVLDDFPEDYKKMLVHHIGEDSEAKRALTARALESPEIARLLDLDLNHSHDQSQWYTVTADLYQLNLDGIYSSITPGVDFPNSYEGWIRLLNSGKDPEPALEKWQEYAEILREKGIIPAGDDHALLLDLRGADFSGKDLSHIKSLKNIDFTQASFKNAVLIGVHFNNVNLSYADLSGADGAKREVNSRGDYINPEDRRNPSLTANFDASSSQESADQVDNGPETDTRVYHTWSEFENVSLVNANLQGSKFFAARFTKVDLAGADLNEQTNLRAATIEDVGIGQDFVSIYVKSNSLIAILDELDFKENAVASNATAQVHMQKLDS